MLFYKLSWSLSVACTSTNVSLSDNRYELFFKQNSMQTPVPEPVQIASCHRAYPYHVLLVLVENVRDIFLHPGLDQWLPAQLRRLHVDHTTSVGKRWTKLLTLPHCHDEVHFKSFLHSRALSLFLISLVKWIVLFTSIVYMYMC